MTACKINNPEDCFGPCACGERQDKEPQRWRFDATNGDPETGDQGDLVLLESATPLPTHPQQEKPNA